ncbi:hypothetical protein [Ancylobacter terrae]|uniref:hypothetical protein n=1 Tax=Ancylobacter sp. sgz301288 TaxID=3342077 RepID=UPI00385D1FD2
MTLNLGIGLGLTRPPGTDGSPPPANFGWLIFNGNVLTLPRFLVFNGNRLTLEHV